MDNIVTYAESVLEPVSTRAFTSVDSLICAWLSYLHLPAREPLVRTWEGARLLDLFRADYFDEMFDGVWDPESTRRLLTALAASPRFRDMRVCGFTEQLDVEQEKQFAAVAFQVSPDLAYVAFRGTDSTLVGWKEDFNIAFKTPIPSQDAAARYAALAAEHLTGRIMVGGHSKGGNLAVYAAAICAEPARARIERAFSHDGPGFPSAVLETPEFVAAAPLVDKTLPQSSVVGMLLESQEDFNIVRSRQVSVWQHDPFSWEVELPEGRFKPVERLAADAKYLDSALNGWIEGMSEIERERFSDALFDVLNAAGAGTFEEIFSDWQKNLPVIMRAAANLDADTRDFLWRILRALARFGVKSVPAALDFNVPDFQMPNLFAGKAGEKPGKAEKPSGPDDQEDRVSEKLRGLRGQGIHVPEKSNGPDGRRSLPAE